MFFGVFTYKMAAKVWAYWHRYRTKLRHCHLICIVVVVYMSTLNCRPEWLGSRVVSALDSGAEGTMGSNRSRDAVG